MGKSKPRVNLEKKVFWSNYNHYFCKLDLFRTSRKFVYNNKTVQLRQKSSKITQKSFMRSTLGVVFKKRFFSRSLRKGRKHSSLFGTLVSFEAKNVL